MKKIFCVIIGCLFSVFTFSQDEEKYKCLDSLLVSKSNEVEEAYSWIKKFRDDINLIYDFRNVDSIYKEKKQNVYRELFDSLALLKINHRNMRQYLDDECTDSSFDIGTCRSTLDTLNKACDLLLFYVDFERIKQNSLDSNVSILLDMYNKKLEVVGKRMGRVIQKAILEKIDYITPASMSRLNLALMELGIVHKDLMNEYKHALKIDGIYDDLNYLFKKRSVDHNFIIGLIDFNDYYGVGYYKSKKYDWGIDVLYSYKKESSLIVHPKIGFGEGIFHYAVGAYYDFNTNVIDPSGNFLILNRTYLGGISFSKNRLTFNIGINLSSK